MAKEIEVTLKLVLDQVGELSHIEEMIQSTEDKLEPLRKKYFISTDSEESVAELEAIRKFLIEYRDKTWNL